MNLHYFQHVPYEGLDRIEDWAVSRGHTLSATHLYLDEKPPMPDEYDALIILGGPQSAYADEKCSWMADEKQAIWQAIDSGKKVLGICLGAQMIASVLGAHVYPHSQKEIGWWPVTFNAKAAKTALSVFGSPSAMYHWHGDTFDLPPGATLLASTPGCKNQAYSVGANVLALQFHPEISFETIDRWVKESDAGLKPSGYVMGLAEMKKQASEHLQTLKPQLETFLDRFFE